MSKRTCVYLIHFAEKFSHASHYIGFTKNEDPLVRLEEHRSGKGAKLTAAVAAAGIEMEIVRTWPGESRSFERQLKNRREALMLCPKCSAEKKARKAELARARYAIKHQLAAVSS